MSVDSMSVEIIRLLKDLVKSVSEQSKMLKENNELLQKNFDLLKKTYEKSGSGNFDVLSDTIKTSVESLQKGVQVLELHRALQDVRSMMGTISKSTVEGVPKSQTKGGQSTQTRQAGTLPPPPQPTSSTKSPTEKDDSLLKPSDLFG